MTRESLIRRHIGTGAVTFVVVLAPLIFTLQRFVDPLSPLPVLQQNLLAAWYALLGIALCLFAIVAARETPISYRMVRFAWRRDLGFGVLLAAVELPLTLLLARGIDGLTTGTRLHIEPQEVAFGYSATVIGNVVFVGSLVLNSFAEEFAFRGILLQRFRDELGRWAPAVLLSSLFFASYHIYQGWPGFACALLYGVLLSVAVIRTGSLWVAVVAHTVTNLIAASPLFAQ